MMLLPTVTGGILASTRGEKDSSGNRSGPSMLPVALIHHEQGLAPLPTRPALSRATNNQSASNKSPCDQTPRISGGGGKYRVHGVVFDLGDVLFDATVWRRWLLRLLRRFGIHAPYHSLFRRWDCEYLTDVYRGVRDYDDAFPAFLKSLGLTRGQVAEISVASQARHREFNLQSRPYPGVVTTLRRLRQMGLHLAVLTNSARPGSDLVAALERLGLVNLFETVITSIDLGMLITCDKAYQEVHDRLQLAVGEVLFVGHDRSELASARRFGMPTVAFNYEASTLADAHIEQFDELIELMADLPIVRAA